MTCSSTALNHYEIGQVVRLQVVFETTGNVATDPPIVTCKVTSPSGAVATYIYGVDTEVLVRDSEGNYSCYVAVDLAGKWPYKFFAEDDPDTPLYQREAGAEEGAFLVDPSEIDGLGTSGNYGGGIDGGSP